MKLWGWWRKDENSVAAGEEAIAKHEAQFLEDLAPKFEDDVASREKMREAHRNSVREAISSISTEDFKHLNKVPCYRSAILTGVGIGVVAGGVVFIAKRPLSQVSNWGMTGFIVGSAISWEQCRYRMRQGQHNMATARQNYARTKALEEANNGNTGSSASA